MLERYGNHPSFMMLTHGNEPAGPNHARWLADWVAHWKQTDPRRLYTTGSGWPVRPGSDYHSSPEPRLHAWGQGLDSPLNSHPPTTDFDFSDFVKRHSDAPVISHEIGQWCAYPNFEEIAKYTGYFKARNFEVFRASAEKHGLLSQAHDFLMASGKLQTLCYKQDIEAALRTSGFGGFQLLDLHDFPGQGTALVGVLDAFWDEKAYVNAKEFRRFCGPVVPLARIPKLVLEEGESVQAELQLAQFGPEDFPATAVEWTLRQRGGPLIASGQLPARPLPSGEWHNLGSLTVPVANLAGKAAAWILEVALPETEIANHWSFFVFPKSPPVATPEGVLFTSALDEPTRAKLRAGGTVFWTPDPAALRGDERLGPVQMGFSPIFWNTAWTNWQPPHTLGILCDPAHPALAHFPASFHTHWQWWGPVRKRHPFLLTEFKELRPIVQVIDDWFTNRKLGLVFEARVEGGRLLACAADLDGQASSRQLRRSLFHYISGPNFQPAQNMSWDDINSLLATKEQ